MSRTIVVGDIHGCFVEFQELVDKLKLGPRDRLVLVGDLMDKGPDPVSCVRLARELGADCLLGNHEEKHLRWRKHEDRRAQDPNHKNPMKPLPEEVAAQNAALSAEDVEWMRKLPITLRLGNWLAVHAGVLPNHTVEAQSTDKKLWDKMIRVRWVDDSGEFVGLDPEDPRQPEGCRPWMEVFNGEMNVVFGHAVHRLSEPRVDRRPNGFECWGIDTGCVFGGRLTALVLETKEVIQVPARRVWRDPPFPIPA